MFMKGRLVPLVFSPGEVFTSWNVIYIDIVTQLYETLKEALKSSLEIASESKKVRASSLRSSNLVLTNSLDFLLLCGWLISRRVPSPRSFIFFKIWIADWTGYFPFTGKHQLLREMKEGDTDVSKCVTILRIFSFSTFLSFSTKPLTGFNSVDSSDVAGGQRLYFTLIRWFMRTVERLMLSSPTSKGSRLVSLGIRTTRPPDNSPRTTSPQSGRLAPYYLDD